MASNARKPLLKAFLSICLKLLVVPKITKPFLLATLAALHFSSFRFPDTSYFICVKGVSLLCQDFFFFFFLERAKKLSNSLLQLPLPPNCCYSHCSPAISREWYSNNLYNLMTIHKGQHQLMSDRDEQRLDQLTQQPPPSQNVSDCKHLEIFSLKCIWNCCLKEQEAQRCGESCVIKVMKYWS